MLFQLRQPPFLSVPCVVFTGSLPVTDESVCWWRDEDADLEMDSYCSCLKWLPLAATDIQAVKCLVKLPLPC